MHPHTPALTVRPTSDHVAPHHILNALPIGISIVAVNGEIIHLKQAGMRILGWSQQTVLSRSFHELLECLAQHPKVHDNTMIVRSMRSFTLANRGGSLR